MEFTLYEDVGFTFKIYQEVAQLTIERIEKLGEGGIIYTPEQIFMVGDKSKVKKWDEVIFGEGYVSEIISDRDVSIELEITSIRCNRCERYKFRANPIEIICTEKASKYETITRYDGEGFESNTNFFHHFM